MALGDFVTGYVHRPVTVSPNSVVHKETFNAFFLWKLLVSSYLNIFCCYVIIDHAMPQLLLHTH